MEVNCSNLDFNIEFLSNGFQVIDTSINSQLICETNATPILGCTDILACNYDLESNTDDGSCQYSEQYYDCNGDCLNDTDGDGVCDELEVPGCTDNLSCNYDLLATEEDGSCQYSEQYYDCNGDCLNDTDGDGVCDELEVPGCTDNLSCNYDLLATEEDGSCQYSEQYYDCNGDCLNDTDGDGVCDELEVPGCTDNLSCNYDLLATEEDGSCQYSEQYYDCNGDCLNDADGDATCDELEIVGCQDPSADNYDANATDEGYCEYLGCTDLDACNYDAGRNTDDGSCIYPEDYYDCSGICLNDTDGDGVCDELEIVGCQDPSADNYDANATDEGYCEYLGCTNTSACNYDSESNTDDGSCEYPEEYYDCSDMCLNDTDGDGICDELEIVGCQDLSADNYDANATDLGNCIYYGCMDVNADNFNPNANVYTPGSCIYFGCLDPLALNYDLTANSDDGSCIYNVADFGCVLPDTYSGLVTGSNMSILITDNFTSQIEILSDQAYIVGLTNSEMIVGSAPISQGEVTSITLWGDDQQTNEIDGAISWEEISLYIVDGTNLYRIIFDNYINYSENQTSILNDFDDLQTICLSGYYTQIPVYGCLDPLASNYITPIGDPTVDANTDDGTCEYNNDFNCEFPQHYDGSITGINMNILLTEEFINSLPNFVEGSYIVAANSENTTFGSVDVFGTTVNALTVWGDDIATPSVDGAVQDEEIYLYLSKWK